MIGEDGEQLGIMSLRDALTLARERGLDLVEVASNSDPPVCRILDYGRFRYLQAKKDREGRKGQKSTALREVRVRPGIGQHDLDAKFRTVKKLLGEGARVKISVVFRGRSITHPELGMGLLKRIAEGLQAEAKLDQTPTMEGRMLSIILSPSSRRDGGRPATPAPPKDKVLAAQGANDAKTQDP